MMDIQAIASQALNKETADAISAASRGDLQAHRNLMGGCLLALGGGVPDGPNDDLFAMEALFHARMCAAQGDQTDLSRLAGALCTVGNVMHTRGRYELADRVMAEAIGLLDHLAESGNELAAVAINSFVQTSPPHVIAQAKAYAAIGKESAA